MYILKKILSLKIVIIAYFFLLLPFTPLAAAPPKKPIAIPPPPYTQSQVGSYLAKGWAGFKMKFILSNGRVVRPEDGNDTVSEGQAYAMLFAVHLNDQVTFDKCFQWAEQNLSRTLPGSAPYGGPDNLLAWRWIPGQGIQGNNWDAAADADGDYAFALLLAYEKWGNSLYLSKAVAVLQDILAKEVYTPTNIPLGNLLYLKPGNWGEANIYGHQGIFINPSYFSPYWYRKFNQYLPDVRWQKLVDGCYQIIGSAANAIQNPAAPGVFTGVGLMPDWAFVDDFGNIYFTGDPLNDISVTLSSWDAFRTPWRIYFDLNATGGTELRASIYLNQLLAFYEQQFSMGQQIVANYYYSGLPAVSYTSPAASGIPLLTSSLDPSISIDQQTGTPQTALAYILKSAPTNPPINNQFSGPNTFQDFGSYGYFIAPGDILRYYINSWGLLGLLTAYYTPSP